MTQYTVENLIQIACFDVNLNEFVYLSDINIGVPFRNHIQTVNCYIQL